MLAKAALDYDIWINLLGLLFSNGPGQAVLLDIWGRVLLIQVF